jgi:hypothetical protein
MLEGNYIFGSRNEIPLRPQLSLLDLVCNGDETKNEALHDGWLHGFHVTRDVTQFTY